MGEQTTVRKVQRLGGSSLIVTLPKQWARRLGVKVGDEIMVVDEGGKLVILPVSPQEKANSVQVKYSGIMRAVGLEALVDCAFTHGYDRLELIMRGASPSDVKRVVDELRANPKVSSVEVGTDRVAATIAPSASDAPRLLRELNSALQDLLDAAKAGNLSAVAGLRDRALEIAEAAMRASRSGPVDPLAAGLVAALPRAVADVAVVLNDMPDAIDKVKEMLSELLGGLASSSARRLSHASAIAAELSRYAMHTGGKALALVPLADVVMAASSQLACPVILRSDEELRKEETPEE